MNTFKPVEYVKGWCYHVLPLVYDDSLSYEEQICKLTNAVNQCITNINNLPEIVEEAVREFVETQGLENIVRDVFAADQTFCRKEKIKKIEKKNIQFHFAPQDEIRNESYFNEIFSCLY